VALPFGIAQHVFGNAEAIVFDHHAKIIVAVHDFKADVAGGRVPVGVEQGFAADAVDIVAGGRVDGACGTLDDEFEPGTQVLRQRPTEFAELPGEVFALVR
jgi:hypothetical protein